MKGAIVPAAAALLLALAPVAARGKERPAPSAPTDTLRLTVDDAVARAMSTSAEARAARAGVKVAEGQVKEATSSALPHVTGSVSYNRKFDSIFRSAADDTSLGPLRDLFSRSSFAAVHTWTADITASQTIFDGAVGAGVAGARAVRKVAVATRDESLADVQLNVRSAYLDALYAAAVQTIAEEGLAQSRAHLAQVTLFHDQGSRSEYDLLQAQVDAANQEPAVVAARNATEQTLLRLRQLINVPAHQPLALASPLAFEGGQVPVLAAEPGDGSERNALKAADATVRARQLALSAEKWARWPRVTASATISHQAFPQEAWPLQREEFVRAIDGTVRLEWPIFQGFRTFGAVERATAELRQAEAQREQQRERVALEVEQARQEVDRALTTLAARRGTVQLATRAHHLATVRWKNGLSTQLEVSDARLQMQTAEVNEVAAIKDYRLALLRLERATGLPLQLVNQSLDDLSTTLPADGDR